MHVVAGGAGRSPLAARGRARCAPPRRLTLAPRPSRFRRLLPLDTAVLLPSSISRTRRTLLPAAGLVGFHYPRKSTSLADNAQLILPVMIRRGHVPLLMLWSSCEIWHTDEQM